MSAWTLEGTRLVLDAATADAWERSADERREIRRDASLLARQLGQTIDVVDPSDPVPGRICERVSP